MESFLNNLDIKTLGQVFTPKKIVDFMLTLKHNQGSVLEPSAGDGSFLKRLKKAVGIEIDPKICPKNALCMDFFDYPLENQFDTIIGNPPYVKHKDIAPSAKEKLHYSLFDERSNLYLFFIEKAIKHLKPKGELIFITPRDFLKSTSSVKLNEWIYKEGTITHFFELGDQKVFPNAMPNCVIFRFCKGNFSRITNNCLQFLCKKGILYFLNQSYTQKLSEVFQVKVGAVSGCDKIFKNEKYGNLEFVTSITKRTNVLEKMVFVNEPNDYLLQHKDSLMQRKIKKFNENNWFEWGRMHHISPKKRIYVNTKTRQKNPFFIHQCPNYDGSILALFPYNQNLDLQNLCDKLNAINWQELGFVCGGRFLFSQRSLENALLPKDFLNLG
ncbi:class I SAM-dependent methyltransferase [Helicobacter pylori]